MQPSVLVAGETLVDLLPDRVGPLSDVAGFTRRAGGAPANVAVGLARLGRTPWFWTRVGSDPFGDFLVDALADQGVPERFVERDPGAKTSLAFVAHDEDADRSFTFYRDRTADTRIEPGGVPDDVLADVDWVAFGGVALATEPSHRAMLDLARRARDHRCRVLFDPNARPELWDAFAFPGAVREAFGLADVVKATPEDLAAAEVGTHTDGGDVDRTTDDPAALAAAVTELGPDTAFLTLGADGACVHATGDAPGAAATARHDGYAVDPVDTTGAGDAFTAGALAALADGEPLEEVLAFANAVAALATTADGAMTALPTREEVAAFREAR